MDASPGSSAPALAPPINVVDPARSSPPRPPTRTEQRDRRDSSWREEQAHLHHQLRLAKAEIATLQAKLGIRTNHVPFNSTSPRQTSPAHDSLSPAPRRKSSISDLAASPSSVHVRRRSSSTVSATSPRSAHFPHHGIGPSSPRTPGRLPEGTGPVAMNRALLSNEGSPSSGPVQGANRQADAVETLVVPTPPAATERAPSPAGLMPNGLPAASPAGGRSPSTASNPFFGSSHASRERLSKSAASAQSGSGRVISGLQSDLLQARTALDSTRGQLRLSQRAVEFLGRQNEDLKETKERLTSEIVGLNRQITRKERLQDEALTRARTAEGALQVLQKEHSELERSVKGRMKELEEGARKAEDASAKSEREYTGLRDGLRSMQEGWKEDLRWIREDLARSQRELETKTATISTLLASRAALVDTATASLSSLHTTQSAVAEQHAQATSGALKELTLLSSRSEADARQAAELRSEFGRLRRAMVEYQQDGQGGGEGVNGGPAAGMAIEAATG